MGGRLHKPPNHIHIVDGVLLAVDEKIAALLQRLDEHLLSGYDILDTLIHHVVVCVALDWVGELDESPQRAHILARLHPDLQVAQADNVGVGEDKEAFDNDVFVLVGRYVTPGGDHTRGQVELGQAHCSLASLYVDEILTEEEEVEGGGRVEVDRRLVVVQHRVLGLAQLLVVVVHWDEQAVIDTQVRLQALAQRGLARTGQTGDADYVHWSAGKAQTSDLKLVFEI